jgi:hypothetical protein
VRLADRNDHVDARRLDHRERILEQLGVAELSGTPATVCGRSCAISTKSSRKPVGDADAAR